MSERPSDSPQGVKIKVPKSKEEGAYATAMVVTHGKEEFVLDFIASYAPPPRLASRVIITPHHAKRLAKAVRENVSHYEKNFGELPPPPTPQAAHTVKAGDFYQQLQIADDVQAGAYANNIMIRHSREEFVLDFLGNFPPVAILNARVVVSPGHIQRIANALEARIRLYEDAHGKIGDAPDPTSSSPTDPSDPPLSPDSGPRFKII